MTLFLMIYFTENARNGMENKETVFGRLSFRGNFDYNRPYEAGASCADCKRTCRNNLCGKSKINVENQNTPIQFDFETSFKISNKLLLKPNCSARISEFCTFQMAYNKGTGQSTRSNKGSFLHHGPYDESHNTI